MVTISNGKEKLYAVMRHTYTHADMLKDKTNARDKKCSQFPEGFFSAIALFALARCTRSQSVHGSTYTRNVCCDAFKESKEVFIQFIRVYFILLPLVVSSSRAKAYNHLTPSLLHYAVNDVLHTYRTQIIYNNLIFQRRC